MANKRAFGDFIKHRRSYSRQARTMFTRPGKESYKRNSVVENFRGLDDHLSDLQFGIRRVVIERTVAGLWLADRLSRRNVESMRSRPAKPMTTLGQPPRKGKLDSVVRQVLVRFTRVQYRQYMKFRHRPPHT